MSETESRLIKVSEKAPVKGTVYAVLRDRIEFRKYDSLDSIKDIINADNLLEIHLFDKEKEYRMVQTRMNGWQDSEITDASAITEEKCKDEKTKKEYVYEENVFVMGSEEELDKADGFTGKVSIVNYLTYNEDDMITIRNYRLKEVE